MEATQVKEGEAINNIFEGLDPAIRENVIGALEFFGKEKSENGNKIEDVVKVNKLRNAYNTLVGALINERMNNMNKYQELFMCTGAIGDTVDINGSKITLIDPPVYAQLFADSHSCSRRGLTAQESSAWSAAAMACSPGRPARRTANDNLCTRGSYRSRA